MNKTRCYKEIGELSRLKREKKGLTQETLSLIVELARPTIANIEVGRQPVRIHYLYRIANALEVSVYDLLPKIE
ncbi:helix-turn-helix domain-containing protein [Paenibacillus sp. NPDC058910]|uniref:helix-turn-helix domain-containing protein n=1 Tax=unclassified Paenibacillus TaxID=185978 RepID=UPI0036963A98